MEGKKYVEMLKNKSRAPIYAAMRQALCYYLFSNNVTGFIIKEVMHMPKSNVYFSINQARDMLEVGDDIMQRAYEEVQRHKIRVVPVTAEGDILSNHIGYRMTIDNIIY